MKKQEIDTVKRKYNIGDTVYILNKLTDNISVQKCEVLGYHSSVGAYKDDNTKKVYTEIRYRVKNVMTEKEIDSFILEDFLFTKTEIQKNILLLFYKEIYAKAG